MLYTGERGGVRWTLTSFIKDLDYLDGIMDLEEMALDFEKEAGRIGLVK